LLFLLRFFGGEELRAQHGIAAHKRLQFKEKKKMEAEAKTPMESGDKQVAAKKNTQPRRQKRKRPAKDDSKDAELARKARKYDRMGRPDRRLKVPPLASSHKCWGIQFNQFLRIIFIFIFITSDKFQFFVAISSDHSRQEGRG
jgi:hypothetical protein